MRLKKSQQRKIFNVTGLYALLVLCSLACKLKDQPMSAPIETSFLELLAKKYNCSVARYYSEAYLRYNKPGSYLLKFNVSNSADLVRINTDSRALAHYIDSAILKSEKLITSISFYISIPTGSSSEVVKHIDYPRDSLISKQSSND